MKISIILPCFNEEKRIGKTLRQIISHCKKRRYTYEIIVVDDGSNDGTRRIVSSFHDKSIRLTKKRENRGKGYSVRQGALMAKNDLILFSDADMSTPISELEKFIPLARQFDIIIGTRTDMKKLKVRQPIYREMMGRTFSLLKRAIVGLRFQDTQCGFKLFGKKAVPLFRKQRIDHFAFDVELLYLARRANLRVKEVPVVWINDARSTVDPLVDSIKMLKDLVKIRWLHARK